MRGVLGGAHLVSAHHTPEKLALKRAFVEIVRGVGGVEVAAMHCRIGKSLISEQGRPESESFPAIDVIHDLQPLARDRAGWPQVTRELAAQDGFVLVALPEVAESERDYLLQLCAMTKEHGDVAAALGRALADGVLTTAERAEVRAELWHVIEVAVALHAQLGER